MKYLITDSPRLPDNTVEASDEFTAVCLSLKDAVPACTFARVFARTETSLHWRIYACERPYDWWSVVLEGTAPLCETDELLTLRALVATIPAIKANVRDACSVACAEVVARHTHDSDAVAEFAEGAQECGDAIAALDLEAL